MPLLACLLADWWLFQGAYLTLPGFAVMMRQHLRQELMRYDYPLFMLTYLLQVDLSGVRRIIFAQAIDWGEHTDTSRLVCTS